MELDELRALRPASALARTHRPLAFKKPGIAKDFIPVVATGGIGDLVIALYVCSQIGQQRGPVWLWTRYPDAAEALLKSGSYHGITLIREPFPGYDAWIQLNSAVNFRTEKNFRRFRHAGMEQMHRAWEKFIEAGDWRRFCHYHPWLDNEMGREAVRMGYRRHTLALRMLGLKAGPHKPVNLKGRPFDWEPFITVHDGFDTTQTTTGRATKTWNLKHWTAVVRAVKARWPALTVIQLGGPTSRPIQGVDVDLVGKTSIADALRLLQRSELHIDGDSGLVHARTAMGLRNIVLFGPTPKEFFGYATNVNVGPRKCGGCWWLKDSWLAECPLELEKPECMDSIAPSEVIARIRGFFDQGGTDGRTDQGA